MVSTRSVQQVKEYVTARLGGRAAQDRSVRLAYAGFVRRHPEWAAALFDAHFVHHGAQPILRMAFDAGVSPDPAVLAAAWADQLWMPPQKRQQLIIELTPAAAEFLRDVMAAAQMRGRQPSQAIGYEPTPGSRRPDRSAGQSRA